MELLTRSLYFRGYAAVNRIFPTISSSRLLATTSTIVVNDSPLQVLPSIDLPELIQRKAIDHMQKSDEPFNIVNIGDIVYKIKTWFSLLPRVHSYFANPVTFHKCEFMKGECGWKQLRAVDFTDWERDAKIGMVLNSKYENINGQYANMISPPMVKSHEAKSIRVQISFGYNGSYTGNLYVMVMYPKYSDKLKVIDTINPQSALLGPLTITRYQIFFSPLYTDYQHSGRLNANTLTPNKIWRNNRTTIYFKTKMERSSVEPSEVCSNISGALDKDFPIKDNIHILAEPDRYFAETAFTLVVCVIGKRKIYGIDQKISAHKKSRNEVCNKEIFNYYVNDGRYGSFSEFLMSYGCRYPKVNGKKSKKLYSTCLWGPTVSGSDCIFHECYLPEERDCAIKDILWTILIEMGAYTSVLATNFNGFTRPVSYYVIDQRMWNMAKDKLLAKFKVAHEYSPKIDTFNQIEYETLDMDM
ncbi:uncharacterized protein TRIADDRAFT_52094 [Trichoplax adhaerens]|uniref:Orn/DAP/Arg decarboxylase 2 C-terminal domain-containing protein n=1 Tax=Trichoplax adhaerens TaxID=10228 RepID=B3RLR5_TRIAD|nr:hypothetical protein TRIADDRAFT_52094 [Trichoplax adhaerens]EDV28830.1 hypothetical protein TRIADDRAFT_52094 [Trichoplax adhaerens]|eukprot:XP_002108032.1 hypothetical protein TRIADDRAFT_52094 [Trichoplax adhaerens]